MRIVALDLSLTGTGVAWPEGDQIATAVVNAPGHVGPERLGLLRDAITRIVVSPTPARLVVLEGYAFGRPEKAHALGELGGVIRVELHEHGFPLAVIPPAKVKKYACGNGNAKKELVFGSAIHRAGREFATNDEADAWWLYQMAAAHYGLPHVQMPAANRAVLDTVEWPALEVPA